MPRKTLSLRGEPATIFSPNRGAMLHVTLEPVAVGHITRAHCGRKLMVAVGGEVHTATQWLKMPEQLRCSPCETIVAEHGTIK